MSYAIPEPVRVTLTVDPPRCTCACTCGWRSAPRVESEWEIVDDLDDDDWSRRAVVVRRRKPA